MGRPRTQLGTYGKITSTGYADAGRKEKLLGGKGKAAVWVARTRFRDVDGQSRLVEASAPTKGKAETLLKTKLADRQHAAAAGDLTGSTTVGAAADFWLGQLDGEGLAEGTVKLYRGNVARYIKGSDIEHLTLREANRPAVLERWLKRVADTNGNAAAKGARSVLSRTLTLAVRYDVIPFSALAATKTPRATKAKQSKNDPNRALTREELEQVKAFVDSDPDCQHHDIADLVWFLAGTGVRINEALTVRWSDLDLATGEVHVRGTKTASSDRHLPLPGWLTGRLSDRLQGLKALDREKGTALAGTGYVFHSPGTLDREKPRNRDNAVKRVRRALAAAGHPWATSHTFRRSVVTRIIESGYDIGRAADQAGHASITTTAGYVGRKRSTKEVADVL